MEYCSRLHRQWWRRQKRVFCKIVAFVYIKGAPEVCQKQAQAGWDKTEAGCLAEGNQAINLLRKAVHIIANKIRLHLAKVLNIGECYT